MKQFEVRTKDLKTVIESLPEAWGVREAIAWKNERSIADYVLVFHEFETPAEADAARLDWLQENSAGIEIYDTDIMSSDNKTLFRIGGDGIPWKETVREAIDDARQAPQPTVRVIAAPDGPVDPT